MNPLPLFGLQFVWFLLVWALLARLGLWPETQKLTHRNALRAWIAPQMFRVLGVGLLVPQLAPNMPQSFALSTSIGDTATAVLAVAAFTALSKGHRLGETLAWLVTLVGGADLVFAMTQAARIKAALYLHAQWYVPALVVPLMAVAHVGCACLLLRQRPAPAA